MLYRRDGIYKMLFINFNVSEDVSKEVSVLITSRQLFIPAFEIAYHFRKFE